MFFDDDALILSDLECRELLASTNIGRMSVNIDALPVVVPVRYGYLGGNIVLCLEEGPVPHVLARGSVVGLGVDNAGVSGKGWAVVVIGHTSEITDHTECPELQAQTLTTRTGTTRPRMIRLWPDIITGARTRAD